MTLLKERDILAGREAIQSKVRLEALSPATNVHISGRLTPEMLASETNWAHLDLEFNDPRTVTDTITEMVDVGRRDTALGRLVEGHVHALQLMHRYGNGIQQAQARMAGREGRVYGVWHIDQSDNPLRTHENRLRGAKAFAAGAGLLTHAIVTTEADDPRHVQMWVVELDPVSHTIEQLSEKVADSARNLTEIVSFDERAAPAAVRLGHPGDYTTQPDYSGGNLRFAAVQAGGVAGLFDGLLETLTERGAADESLSRRRIAQAYVLAQNAINAVVDTAKVYDIEDPRLLPRVGAARHSVIEAAEAMLDLVRRAVGVESLSDDHPLAIRVRDVRAYIRQPEADGSADYLADAILNKDLRPGIVLR